MNPRRSFADTLDQVGKRHGVEVREISSRGGREGNFFTPGLPILPFFLDLALDLDVPVSSISATNAELYTDGGGGTWTGPGFTEFTGIEWEVKLP